MKRLWNSAGDQLLTPFIDNENNENENENDNENVYYIEDDDTDFYHSNYGTMEAGGGRRRRGRRSFLSVRTLPSLQVSVRPVDCNSFGDFSVLPEELLVAIFQHLDFPSLVNLSSTCGWSQSICKDSAVFSEIAFRTGLVEQRNRQEPKFFIDQWMARRQRRLEAEQRILRQRQEAKTKQTLKKRRFWSKCCWGLCFSRLIEFLILGPGLFFTGIALMINVMSGREDAFSRPHIPWILVLLPLLLVACQCACGPLSLRFLETRVAKYPLHKDLRPRALRPAPVLPISERPAIPRGWRYWSPSCGFLLYPTLAQKPGLWPFVVLLPMTLVLFVIKIILLSKELPPPTPPPTTATFSFNIEDNNNLVGSWPSLSNSLSMIFGRFSFTYVSLPSALAFLYGSVAPWTQGWGSWPAPAVNNWGPRLLSSVLSLLVVAQLVLLDLHYDLQVPDELPRYQIFIPLWSLLFLSFAAKMFATTCCQRHCGGKNSTTSNLLTFLVLYAFFFSFTSLYLVTDSGSDISFNSSSLTPLLLM